MFDLNRELLRNLPEINRAREYRIYDKNGKKIIDCFLDAGRFICGHRPEKSALAIKNEVSKGSLYNYPTICAKSLDRHLKKIFPKVKYFYLFKTEKQLFAALEKPNSRIVEAVFYNKKKNEIPVWRPFSQASKSLVKNEKYFIANLPKSFDDHILLCSNKKLKNKNIEEAMLTGASANSLIKNIVALGKKKETFEYNDFSEFENTKIVFDGQYFYIKNKNYDSVFNKALESAILLSSDEDVLSFFPDKISHGEKANLTRFLRNFK